MQLDALLRSLHQYSKNFFNDIIVIYKTSHPLHTKSYQLLLNRFPDIKFYKENLFNSFKKRIIKSLNNDYEYIMFMTDDDILFDNISESDKYDIVNLMKEYNLATFSLRLGINCIYSHPANKFFKVNNYQVIKNKYLIWNWTEQMEGDFNYPLSLDGHLFLKNQLLNWVKSFKGLNPNHLESYLQRFNNSISKKMGSFVKSKLVGIPVNLVSNYSSNYYGKTHYYSPIELAQRYINDEEIDFFSMDFSNIIGAHQELKLVFRRKINLKFQFEF